MTATLVTGGTGYLGAPVIRELVARGEKVVCFDLFTSSPRLADVASRVRFVRGDVTAIEEIIAAVKENDVSRIVHLAYLKTAEAEVQLQKAMRVNVMGTNNVFEAARLSGVRRVVYISSIGFYGQQSSFGERPVTEEDRGQPMSVYGYTKGLNDYMAKRYAEMYGLEPACLRLAFTFGHGREGALTAWPTAFASNPAVGKPASMPSDPKRRYCVIYVDDVADIICHLATKGHLEHQVYLSGGYTKTVEELAQAVKEFIPDAQFTYDGEGGDHNYVYLVDNSRLRHELGIELPPFRQRVLDHINEARRAAGMAELAG